MLIHWARPGPCGATGRIAAIASGREQRRTKVRSGRSDGRLRDPGGIHHKPIPSTGSRPKKQLRFAHGVRRRTRSGGRRPTNGSTSTRRGSRVEREPHAAGFARARSPAALAAPSRGRVGGVRTRAAASESNAVDRGVQPGSTAFHSAARSGWMRPHQMRGERRRLQRIRDTCAAARTLRSSEERHHGRPPWPSGELRVAALAQPRTRPTYAAASGARATAGRHGHDHEEGDARTGSLGCLRIGRHASLRLCRLLLLLRLPVAVFHG